MYRFGFNQIAQSSLSLICEITSIYVQYASNIIGSRWFAILFLEWVFPFQPENIPLSFCYPESEETIHIKQNLSELDLCKTNNYIVWYSSQNYSCTHLCLPRSTVHDFHVITLMQFYSKTLELVPLYNHIVSQSCCSGKSTNNLSQQKTWIIE